MPDPRPAHWELTTFYRPADVIVVGAGLTGLQTALALKNARPALDVLLLERAAVPQGASTRNAGFACFGGPTELLADLDAYGEEAVAATVGQRLAGVRALERNFARRGIGWQKLGGYEWIDDPAVADRVLSRLPALNRLLAPLTGLPRTWSVVPADDPARRPFRRGAGHVLLRNPLEAQLHPGKLVTTLLADCRRAGVRTLFGCDITDVTNDGDRVEVTTAGGVALTAGRAVVTVNAFVNRLTASPAGSRVRPVRNQVLLSRSFPDLNLRGCYHYHEGYVYFRNVGPDRLLIGGARHRAGAASETTAFGPNGVPEAYLIDKLNAWLPGRGWSAADFPVRWSGILAQGDGKEPVLRYAAPRLLVAGRLAGMGVALSADLARRAAARVLAAGEGAFGPATGN